MYRYCNNCGKTGHYFKKCLEPITSMGIIAFKIDLKNLSKDLNINIEYTKFLNSLNEEKNILRYNSINIDKINKCFKFKKYIKFLLISRKVSLGYIEFMRGRYNTNNLDSIVNLYKQMYPTEIENLNNKTFTELWIEIWQIDNLELDNEYIQSKNKYDIIKKNTYLDYCNNNIKSSYSNHEWGFPKGRRSYYESNIECAKREFIEESNLKNEDFNLLENLEPLVENLTGTNKKNYKHIYYLAFCKNELNVSIDKNNKFQSKEVGNIQWLDYDNVIKLIRNYHVNKKLILNNLIIFIISLILDFK